MKKEDFTYGSAKYYIDNAYVLETKNYLLIIEEDIFDEDTIKYANEIIKKYEKEKNEILEYMIKKRLREFYRPIYNYSDEYIKTNIGRPLIKIDCKKDNTHPNWKFKYAGTIDFFESNLDEHIISIEFIDDLNLDSHIQING